MSGEKSLQIRYVGARFASGRLPIEMVSDLPAFLELLLIFAKEMWRSNNTVRRRLPRGFEQSFSFELVAILDGSAIAKIELRRASEQRWLPGFGEADELLDASCSKILDLIDSAGTNRDAKALEAEQIRVLNRFGSGLDDGEKIEIHAGQGFKPRIVYLDNFRRKSLITRGGQRYTRKFEGVGTLAGLHQKGNIEVQTAKYGELKIPISSDRVKDEFNKHESLGATVQFSLMVELDSEDRYKSVKDVYEVELIDQERSDKVMNRMQRLDELQQLDEGWLNGSGHRISDQALYAAKRFLHKRPDLANDFRIYPMEDGGISFEFENNGWDFSIEFGSTGTVEMFGIQISGPAEMEPTVFEGVDNSFLAEFDKRTTS